MSAFELWREKLAADRHRPLLRLFVYRSDVELVANRRRALSKRIYPGRSDSTGFRLFARGGRAQARAPDFWRMAPV